MKKQICPECGTNNTMLKKTHSNYPRYECFDCGNEWSEHKMPGGRKPPTGVHCWCGGELHGWAWANGKWQVNCTTCRMYHGEVPATKED